MYIIVAIVMLLRGFADAIMMRSQQALALGGRSGLPATSPLRSDLHRARRDYDLLRGDAFRYRSDELWWFRCRSGARDVAFPFLNNLSFWFTVVGVIPG